MKAVLQVIWTPIHLSQERKLGKIVHSVSEQVCLSDCWQSPSGLVNTSLNVNCCQKMRCMQCSQAQGLTCLKLLNMTAHFCQGHPGLLKVQSTHNFSVL